MQKTFLKFAVFELVERIARFRLLLTEYGDALLENSPVLYQGLQQAAAELEAELLAYRPKLNPLFSEAGNKPGVADLEGMLSRVYSRLQELSQVLLQVRHVQVEPETYLFLKDALTGDLLSEAGEQSVFLAAEGQSASQTKGFVSNGLPHVLIDSLSVLQKNNPLAWVGLTQSYSRHLLAHASSLESLKLDLVKSGKKCPAPLTEAQADTLILHALNLRLLGPAYYFHALTEAVLQQDNAFFHQVEPALFYGLNHQNFTHKNLVILHEAAERFAQDMATEATTADEVSAILFRAVEKTIPARAAFAEKHFERAIQLQERLSEGILLSSTPVYPVDEVAESLQRTRQEEHFSIYGPLSMMTEYPHTPREIVNAGWLHKVDRGPIWLYTILNETDGDGFAKILDLLDYQDHLLRKSIEVSEVHRVLLCS